MLAGIEAELTKCGKEVPKKVQTNIHTDRNGRKRIFSSSKRERNKKRFKPVNNASKRGRASKRKPLVSDCWTEIDSLLRNNIHEDANENLNLRKLPSEIGKNTQRALTALFASVPLEERGSIRGERTQLFKSIKILGARRVHPDGAGSWKFKGENSFI